MAKENVIIFDGEDKFIKPKKHVYSKTKGKSAYANAVGTTASATNQDENVVASDTRAIKSTIVPNVTTSSTTTESVAPAPFIPKGNVEDIGTAADRKLALIEQKAAEAAAAAAKVFDDTSGVRGPGISAGLVAQPNSAGGRITEPIQNILTPNPALLTDAQRKAVEEGRASVTLTDTPRSKDSVPTCGEGLVYDALTNQCIAGTKVDVGAGQPSAGSLDSNVVATKQSGILAISKPTPPSTPPSGTSTNCEAGYYFDIPSGMCMKIPTEGHAPCPSGFLWDDTLGKCVATTSTTTSTTTNTTTSKGGNEVIINQPAFGTSPSMGGGGGGGGAFPDETPKAVAPKKSYFWYYVAAIGIGYYLYKKYKK